MIDYLNERKSNLKKQYSALLTEIGDNCFSSDDKDKTKEIWKKVNDLKSRIEEIELIIIEIKLKEL
jgi:hypothetical protein